MLTHYHTHHNTIYEYLHIYLFKRVLFITQIKGFKYNFLRCPRQHRLLPTLHTHFNGLFNLYTPISVNIVQIFTPQTVFSALNGT